MRRTHAIHTYRLVVIAQQGTAIVETTETASAPAEESRRFTEEEQRIWNSYLQAITLLEDHIDRRLQRDAGLAHCDYRVLVRLSEAPRRRLRMTDLAMKTQATRTRVSRHVDRLEGYGWVRREVSGSDKRSHMAVLTVQGSEVLNRAAMVHADAVGQALLDRLTLEQQKLLGEMMEIIADGLHQRDAGASLPWLR
jgi:DNA-binding MarR family transcriptional regulator